MLVQGHLILSLPCPASVQQLVICREGAGRGPGLHFPGRLLTCTPAETGVFTDYFNRGMRIWNHFASTLEKPCGILWPVLLGCENRIADLWTTPLQHNIGSLSYLRDSTELPWRSLESYPNFPHNLEGLGPSHGV